MDKTVNQIDIVTQAVVPVGYLDVNGDGTVFAEKVAVVAGGTGGGAVTVANGADVAEGSTTDAVVTGDNPGTVSSKLRGLNKVLTSVWDSTLGALVVRGSRANSGADAQSGTTHVSTGGGDGTNLRLFLTDTLGRTVTIPAYNALSNILMLGVSGAVTVKGYFTDVNGNKVGNSINSTSVPVGNGTNNPSTMADIYGAALPAGAVGARLVLSGNVYWAADSASAATSDLKTNYARYPQAIADPEFNVFGAGF